MTSLARTIRHAAWTGLPVFLNAAGGIYTLSLNYRVLGPYDYGLLLLIVSINGFLGILASSLGLTARTSGALIAGQDPEGRALRTLRGVQFLYVAFGVILFILSLLAGLLGSAVFNVQATSVESFRLAVPLIGLASVFQFQAAVPGAILAAHDRFAAGAKISLLSLILRILALTVLVPLLGLVGNALVLAGGAILEYGLLHRLAKHVVRSLGIWGVRPDRGEFRRIVSGATMMTIVNASSGGVTSTGGLIYVGGVLGPALVSDLRIGTTLPQNLVNLVFVGYGVIYPRFVRGRTLHSPRKLGLALRSGSFSSAALFALLAMAAPSLITLITGRPASKDMVVISTMTCAGLALDAAIHGIVLQILARERQDVLAKVVPGGVCRLRGEHGRTRASLWSGRRRRIVLGDLGDNGSGRPQFHHASHLGQDRDQLTVVAGLNIARRPWLLFRARRLIAHVSRGAWQPNSVHRRNGRRCRTGCISHVSARRA